MSPSRTPRSTGANMRVAAAVLSLLAIALLALDPDAASAGRYEVVQCDRANRAFTDADFDRVNGGDYGFLYRCEEDEDANSLQIRSITGAPQGRSGRISWTAPAETRIVGVDLEARMRNDAGHQARLSFFDDRRQRVRQDRDRHRLGGHLRALRAQPRGRRQAEFRRQPDLRRAGRLSGQRSGPQLDPLHRSDARGPDAPEDRRRGLADRGRLEACGRWARAPSPRMPAPGSGASTSASTAPRSRRRRRSHAR